MRGEPKSVARLFYLPGNAWIIGFTSAVWAIGGSMVNPYQSIFFTALGAPVTYIGILGALSGGITAVMYLVGGFVADVWGRRKVIIVFSFVSALNAFIYVFVKSWTLLFLPVIVGALSGIYSPALNATINDSFEPSLRPRGFASFTIVTTIPSLFAPVAGGYLADSLGNVPGLKLGYFLSGLFGVVAVSYRAITLKETFKAENRNHLDLKGFIRGVINDNRKALAEASSDARKLIAYAGVSSIATGLSTLYISLYLVDTVHISLEVYGGLTAISALTTILLLLPSTSFIEKVGLRWAAVLSALTSPLSMLVFVSANGMNDLVTWSVTGGVSGALVSPAIQSLQGNTVPRRIRGRLMAMFSVVPLLVATPAQVISGYLYADVSRLAPFIISVPFYALSVVILAKVNPHGERE